MSGDLAERPYVICVEDEPSVREFLGMALEMLPVEFTLCEDTTRAEAALRARPASLLMIDLSLPGETGDEFVRRLRSDPGLQQGARVVVFSGGLNPSAQRDLQSQGVWRLVAKPVPLPRLHAVILEALDLTPATAGPAAQVASSRAPHDADPARAAAIRNGFGGDAELHDAFLATCRRQFPQDVEAGDAACVRGDLQVLHVLAHNLKSVLATLGLTEASRMAADLELAASDGERDEAWQLWLRLRGALVLAAT